MSFVLHFGRMLILESKGLPGHTVDALYFDYVSMSMYCILYLPKNYLSRLEE